MLWCLHPSSHSRNAVRRHGARKPFNMVRETVEHSGLGVSPLLSSFHLVATLSMISVPHGTSNLTLGDRSYSAPSPHRDELHSSCDARVLLL